MTQKLAEAQAQINQSSKLASLGRLAAGVAHEIINPLTGVLTYSSFLFKRTQDPEIREDLDTIVRETKRSGTRRTERDCAVHACRLPVVQGAGARLAFL